jgi:hypothetical protein
MVRTTARAVPLTLGAVTALVLSTGCGSGPRASAVDQPTGRGSPAATRGTAAGPAELTRICVRARDAVQGALAASFGATGTEAAAQKTSTRLRDLARDAPAGEVRTAIEALAEEISRAQRDGSRAVPDPGATPAGFARFHGACAEYWARDADGTDGQDPGGRQPEGDGPGSPQASTR